MIYFAHIDPTRSAASPVLSFGWASDPYYVLPAECVALTAAEWAARDTQCWYDPATKSLVAPVEAGAS